MLMFICKALPEHNGAGVCLVETSSHKIAEGMGESTGVQTWRWLARNAIQEVPESHSPSTTLVCLRGHQQKLIVMKQGHQYARQPILAAMLLGAGLRVD